MHYVKKSSSPYVIFITSENFFISGNCDISSIDEGKDTSFEIKEMRIRLTKIHNQKQYLYDNKIYIDLEECENLLRNYYNLTNNETLYIEIIEFHQEGMKIPKVLYYVYSQLSGSNLEKLNL